MAGVDKVVICGVKRAGEPIPVGEIQQSIGRAGRFSGKPGEAVVLCEPDDAAYAEQCLNSPPPLVKSRLSGVDTVAFHVLPWLDRVRDEESYAAWRSRTLAGLQGGQMPSWGEISGYLKRLGFMDAYGDATEMGRISISTYYPPSRLHRLRSRLAEVGETDRFDPFEMSYLFGALVDSGGYLPEWEREQYDDYAGSLHSRGCRCDGDGDMRCFMAYSVVSCQPVRSLRHALAQLRNDFGRLSMAARRVAEDAGCVQAAKWIEIGGLMAVKRVPYEIASVMHAFGGLSRQSACELYDMGIENFEDLVMSTDMVMDNGSDELRKELEKKDLLMRKEDE